MNNLTASDRRKAYHEQLDGMIAADARRDELQHTRDALMVIINASRDNVPGLKLTTDGYIGFKIRLGNVESDLIRARRLAELRREIWFSTPKPKPARLRRTVMIDGVRTRLETAS